MNVPKVMRLFALPIVVTALSLCMALFAVSDTHAAQTVPYRMNFQGRLAGTTGAAMADGTYNMRLRIYSGAGCSTGCTASWTEDRLVSAGNGVTVTGGLFSVQLGSVTTLSPSLFTNQDLFFEVELPTPATATGTSPSWTEGAMTPRNKMGSSAYAFNADTVDGIDGASLAQLSAANAFTGNNTYSGTSTYTNTNTVKVTSTSAFTVQNAGGTSYLNVDTNNGIITLGTGSDIATFTSGGLVYSGSARPSRQAMLSPEYPGATFTGAGVGNLISDFCAGSAAGGSLGNVNASACGGSTSDVHNYYAWTSTGTGVQNYDIYVRYKMPTDFSSGSLANVYMYGQRGSGTTDAVTLSLYQADRSQCGDSTNVATSSTGAWTETAMSGALSSCTIAAGDVVTLKISMSAGTSGNTVRAGEIRFDYRTTR